MSGPSVYLVVLWRGERGTVEVPDVNAFVQASPDCDVIVTVGDEGDERACVARKGDIVIEEVIA